MESDRPSVGKWEFSVQKGELVMFRLFGIERLAIVEEHYPSYVTIRFVEFPKETRHRLYEDQVDRLLHKVR